MLHILVLSRVHNGHSGNSNSNRGQSSDERPHGVEDTRQSNPNAATHQQFDVPGADEDNSGRGSSHRREPSKDDSVFKAQKGKRLIMMYVLFWFQDDLPELSQPPKAARAHTPPGV
ncbi:hypothetical protein POM88_004759 [Heracleum sosnowskyi]|uniref:Uncharacterized protein n=1 Tax=Heracleum sosnowskyi TaxID=360622 RepID=A0AAD8NCU5_9APIA|nr:hypothetical protein POM88_004759 [Heracleum sosnowskyi]